MALQQNRRFDLPSVGDVSQSFTASDGNTDLVAAKTGYTIHVQRIVVTISTSAAQAITFQDNSGSPVYVAKIPASPGVDTRWDFDFGKKGRALGSGKKLVMAMTAGNAGHVQVYSYYKHD